MNRGVGHRCGPNPALLWLWGRPVATTPIGPLAREPPYAVDVALKRKRQKKKKKKAFSYLQSHRELHIDTNSP